jgi:hypothetical protein
MTGASFPDPGIVYPSQFFFISLLAGVTLSAIPQQGQNAPPNRIVWLPGEGFRICNQPSSAPDVRMIY